MEEDNRPEWCKETERHADCFVTIPPYAKLTITWQPDEDEKKLSKLEWTGPCCVAVITD
jgi:hypothetical protein